MIRGCCEGLAVGSYFAAADAGVVIRVRTFLRHACRRRAAICTAAADGNFSVTVSLVGFGPKDMAPGVWGH